MCTRGSCRRWRPESGRSPAVSRQDPARGRERTRFAAGRGGQAGPSGLRRAKASSSYSFSFWGIGRLFPVGSVRDGVVNSCFGESAKPQNATLACAAGGLVACIAGPRYMEGRGEFKAAADYLVLTHRDKGCFDTDGAIARAGANELLKGLVVGRAAVGIAGAVLFDRSDVNGLGSEDLRPTDS